MLCVPKFQEPYPLPGSRIQPPICNRNRHTRSYQRTLHMRGHVVATLCVVPIQTSCSPFLGRHSVVFWDDSVQRIGHVGADVGVVVLVQGQGAGCVLNKKRQEAGFVRGDFGELRGDVRRYEVGAPAPRGEGEGFLEPVTSRVSNWSRESSALHIRLGMVTKTW
jgi:hypothetical protein